MDLSDPFVSVTEPARWQIKLNQPFDCARPWNAHLDGPTAPGPKPNYESPEFRCPIRWEFVLMVFRWRTQISPETPIFPIKRAR
ncbi:hypothetical protein GWI33_009957 [Rhynchophorus ferrugineus]|uniref:Uncharacterized protein n=1 Tax=Rhynchophorus ferrugineus TaxID=354439 RepID=A0A834IVB4_RHYFE|nr:hypothetical protein GWI33_009957 [Rhynchophorus ferrugineus]